jgi:hypothetical protein
MLPFLVLLSCNKGTYLIHQAAERGCPPPPPRLNLYFLEINSPPRLASITGNTI